MIIDLESIDQRDAADMNGLDQAFGPLGIADPNPFRRLHGRRLDFVTLRHRTQKRLGIEFRQIW